MADLNALPLSGYGSPPELLERLVDPRARRGIRRKISVTLAMAVAAGLSGCARTQPPRITATSWTVLCRGQIPCASEPGEVTW